MPASEVIPQDRNEALVRIFDLTRSADTRRDARDFRTLTNSAQRSCRDAAPPAAPPPSPGRTHPKMRSGCDRKSVMRSSMDLGSRTNVCKVKSGSVQRPGTWGPVDVPSASGKRTGNEILLRSAPGRYISGLKQPCSGSVLLASGYRTLDAVFVRRLSLRHELNRRHPRAARSCGAGHCPAHRRAALSHSVCILAACQSCCYCCCCCCRQSPLTHLWTVGRLLALCPRRRTAAASAQEPSHAVTEYSRAISCAPGAPVCPVQGVCKFRDGNQDERGGAKRLGGVTLQATRGGPRCHLGLVTRSRREGRRSQAAIECTREATCAGITQKLNAVIQWEIDRL